jgi:hypothetical protein
MIKTMVLGPKESPFVKSYNNKDNIVAINKHTNSTDFISAADNKRKNTRRYQRNIV